jgi:hypothetical protein
MKDRLTQGDRERLSGLLRTAQAELLHLQQTDQRLFGRPFSPEGLVTQLKDIDFSERVDAFVARFGRLQDLLGDKLLPAWLKAMEEGVGAVLENLDRAETLHSALYAAHTHVDMLAKTVERFKQRSQALLG